MHAERQISSHINVMDGDRCVALLERISLMGKVGYTQHFFVRAGYVCMHVKCLLPPKIAIFTLLCHGGGGTLSFLIRRLLSGLSHSAFLSAGGLQHCCALFWREPQDHTSISFLPSLCTLHQSLQGKYWDRTAQYCFMPTMVHTTMVLHELGSLVASTPRKSFSCHCSQQEVALPGIRCGNSNENFLPASSI